MSLTVDQISYKYREDGKQILKDISFQIDDGDVYKRQSEGYETELKDRAQVLSTFYADAACMKNEAAAAFLYENGKGHRFLVFTFDAHGGGEALVRS